MMKRVSDMTNGESTWRAWYRACVGVALVAGVFSLVVCVLLVANYLQIRLSDPLDSEELAALRATLRLEPNDDSIKERIRELDLELREEYFRRREFSRRGVYLLAAGIVVFLIGARLAVRYHEKLPMPREKSDAESRDVTMARWSVGIFGVILGVAALVLAVLYSGPPYRVAITGPEVPGPGGGGPGAGYPSPEEIRENWPRFRGPGGLGVSAYTNIPTSWDGKTGEGILWKAAIPLPGKNSPIVWDDRVFVTGADEENRAVYCFDANSGELLWQRAVENVPSSSPEPPEVSDDTGFAAPTAVTDGRRVYAMFANGDLICFDFDGNQVWARSMGPLNNIYGHASSLAMYRNLVLVLLDQGGAEDGISELLAIDGASGRTVWKAPRPVPNSWASPIVIDTGEREEIITSANPWVIAYEPATGVELWRAECLGGDVAPSPIYAGGLVFVTNAYELLVAIRPGGQGNVTETHIVWTAEDGLPDICSPLSNGELVFLLETYGLLTCYDAKDGSKVWEEDLGETFTASPSMVGDRVYLLTEDGVMIIVQALGKLDQKNSDSPSANTREAGREFQEIGRCELGEGSSACPAFMDGRIYIRGEENLYCIGSPQKQ